MIVYCQTCWLWEVGDTAPQYIFFWFPFGVLVISLLRHQGKYFHNEQPANFSTNTRWLPWGVFLFPSSGAETITSHAMISQTRTRKNRNTTRHHNTNWGVLFSFSPNANSHEKLLTKRPQQVWDVDQYVEGFDWCCFHYFVRNSLVALLEALCARIFSFRFVNIGFISDIFFCVCVCVQGL